MADDDIAWLLPEPPPPRATRREAAIGAAMRRFDGVEGPAAPARPARAWQRPEWTRFNRTQIGAFASIALVAVVGVPLALTTLERERSLRHDRPAPVSPAADRAPANPVPEAAPEPRARPRTPASPAPSAKQVPELVPPPPPVEAAIGDCGKGDCVAEARGRAAGVSGPFASAKRTAEWVPPPSPPPPPPSPPPPPPVSAPMRTTADQAIAAPGYRAARSVPAAAAPVSRAETEGMDIIVTGSRSTRPAASYRRGDWNACTVNDPGETLDGCKALVDLAARGAAGQAAAKVSEGLSLAWRDDLEGAIAAFAAAIALQPRLAIAYLNRGLAYQRQGDLDRALDDLNRAVRYAPYAARSYYARSLYFRETGDIDRARADEERAVQRDARYRAVVE